MHALLPLASVVIKELSRRKDFYVLFILTALLSVIMGSVNFFNSPQIARYLKEICLFLIWISSLVIAITTAARQIPAERESRTLYPLLAKPVSRAQVLGGKFLGCWFACGLCLVVFYLFFGVLTGVRSAAAFQFLPLLQGAFLHWLMLGMLTAMTLLGSVVFAAPSSNGTICLIVASGILFLGRHLNKIALQMSEPGQTITYALYFAIPHFELFDIRDLIVHNVGLVPAGPFLIVTAYAATYTALFLFAAWLVFRRQKLN